MRKLILSSMLVCLLAVTQPAEAKFKWGPWTVLEWHEVGKGKPVPPGPLMIRVKLKQLTQPDPAIAQVWQDWFRNVCLTRWLGTSFQYVMNFDAYVCVDVHLPK